MKWIGKRCFLSAAVLLAAGCAEKDTAPLGPDEEIITPPAALTRLTCDVEVAAGTMTCGPASADFGGIGNADLIVGSQHQFVRMANDTPSIVGDAWSANVTVQNLTLQPMGTADGAAVSPTGVRVFFVDLPNNGVVVSNADGSAAFTGSDPQQFYAYADALLGADSILSPGEKSAAKQWQFTLNGAATFQFSVLISTAVPDETNYGVHLTRVSAGSTHSCGDGSDGNVYCWGDGADGRLGNGATDQRLTPVAVVSPPGVTLSGVSAGRFHTCANGDDNRVYCWGTGFYGQLGTGVTGINSSTPIEVDAPIASPAVTLSAVTAGAYHTCATGSDDNVYCWGRNDHGQLGDTTNTVRPSPVAVVAPASVTLSNPTPGGFSTCAIGSDANAYCWGDNTSGQLGDSSTVEKWRPVQVLAPAGVTFSHVDAGGSHACALTPAGQAYCWGANSDGQLGNGVSGVSENRNAPVAVTTANSFTELTAGGLHTCGVASDGTAYCWGDSSSGQLGAGTIFDRSSPIAVTPPGTVELTGVSAGLNHSCANGTDGKAYCWGQNTLGQMGDGRTSLGGLAPLPVAGTRRP